MYKGTMYNVQRFCAAGIFSIFFKKNPRMLLRFTLSVLCSQKLSKIKKNFCLFVNHTAKQIVPVRQRIINNYQQLKNMHPMLKKRT